MAKFGERSLKNLETCHPDLQRVLNRAIKIIDFSVIEGHRSLERQKKLYDEGKSQIDGIYRKGKHNYEPSLAADILPYPTEVNGVNVWSDSMRFYVLWGVVKACAHEEGVTLRYGGDWDGDGNNKDSNFNDLPHIELIGG